MEASSYGSFIFVLDPATCRSSSAHEAAYRTACPWDLSPSLFRPLPIIIDH